MPTATPATGSFWKLWPISCGVIVGSPTARMLSNKPARITATISASVAFGIVMSGRFVSSAAARSIPGR